MPLPADLGIVVVNHGHPDQLERNLVGIGRQARCGRVVVVDNFTGIEHRAATTTLCTREGWLLIAPGLDLGFAAAVNAGARLLRSRGCQRLLILSPEVSIDLPGVLSLATGCAADPQRIIGPRITDPDGSARFGGGMVDSRHGRALRTADRNGSSLLSGVSWACLMIHVSLWDWLEGADEGYFRHWEDVDLSWRCLAAGGGLDVRDDITAVRSARSLSGGLVVTTLDIYSVCRNRLAFAARHLSRRHLSRWLLFSPAYALRMVIRGVHADRPGNVGALLVAAMRGTAAGAVLALRAFAPTPGPAR
ncbi:hypothetical protein ACEN2M_18220 [Cryobacterium sp. W22_MBD10_FK3]